jgi:hypothetical protein
LGHGGLGRRLCGRGGGGLGTVGRFCRSACAGGVRASAGLARLVRRVVGDVLLGGHEASPAIAGGRRDAAPVAASRQDRTVTARPPGDPGNKYPMGRLISAAAAGPPGGVLRPLRPVRTRPARRPTARMGRSEAAASERRRHGSVVSAWLRRETGPIGPLWAPKGPLWGRLRVVWSWPGPPFGVRRKRGSFPRGVRGSCGKLRQAKGLWRADGGPAGVPPHATVEGQKSGLLALTAEPE